MKNSTKRLLPLVLLLPLASCEGKINFFDQSFGLIYEKEGHYWLNNGQKVGFQGHAFDKLVLAYEETHTFTTDYVRHYYDYACRCGYKMSYDRLQFRGEDSIDSFFQSNSTEHHRNHKKPRFYQAGVKFIAKQDLPNLVRIEDGAFEESLFNEIEIGGRLEYLGKMAFCGSSIQKVSLA